MSTPYIPASDAGIDGWSANFSTLITAAPGTYGLVTADAVAIAALVATWHADYLLVLSPSTKTKTTVAAKDTARTTMLATLRSYAQQVANNAGVSPSNKTALGLNPRTSIPTPIVAPVTYPVITIPSMLPNGIVIRTRDELASPTQKAKPPGATNLELHGLPMMTGSPTTSIDLWPLLANTTKSPFVLDTTAMPSGETLYIAGRWATRTGLKGPYGTPVAATIP
jgi:hypothetical protein